MKFFFLMALVVNFFSLNASESFENENQVTIVTIDSGRLDALLEELTFEPTIFVIQNIMDTPQDLLDRLGQQYSHAYSLENQLIVSQNEITPEMALFFHNELQSGVYISNQSAVLHVLHEIGAESVKITSVIGDGAHKVLGQGYKFTTLCTNHEVEAKVYVEKKEDEPGSISGSGTYTYESDDGNWSIDSEVTGSVDENGKKEISGSVGYRRKFSAFNIIDN